jgi:nickel/cobalt transporter (NiCoT) family protein
VSIEPVLVFPVLFAAGMSLVDTTDGVMMLGAYDWPFVRPIRKLCYNLTITLVSDVVAVVIGGIEALGLLADQLDLKGAFWDVIGTLNDNFNNLACCLKKECYPTNCCRFTFFISFMVFRARSARPRQP